MSIDLQKILELYDSYRIGPLYADLAIDCAECLPALVTEIQQLRIELELAKGGNGYDSDIARKARVKNMFP